MWYLILSTRKASIEDVKARTADHFEWMQAQHAAGTVAISGPTPDRSMGIYVVRADSAETAHKITASDPFHTHNLREYQLIPWEVHQILGIGPFSVDGIHYLANNDPSNQYTPLPRE